MPTNPDVGRALAELSAGKADRQQAVPVALTHGLGEDPATVGAYAGANVVGASAVMSANAPNGVSTTPGEVVQQVQTIVGPSAIAAPNNGQLQTVATTPMSLEQAQSVVAALSSGVQIGPTAAPPNATPAAATPTATTDPSPSSLVINQSGAVDLEALALQTAVPAQQVAQQPVVTQQPTVDVTMNRAPLSEDAIVDTPLGQMTWREAKANMMRRQEFERQRRALDEAKRSVDGQQGLIHKVAQSRFGAAFTATLNAGGSEEDAMNAGFAASGIQRAAPQSAVEPPLVPPQENDKDYEVKWAQYLSEVSARASRDAVRQEIAPLRAKMNEQEQTLRNSQVQLLQQQRDQDAALVHNRDLYGAYIQPYLPHSLSDAQQSVVTQYLDDVAKAEGIKIDVASKMSDETFRLLAAYAFPLGQIPPTLMTRLSAQAQQVQQQPAQQLAPTQQQYAPQYAVQQQQTLPQQAASQQQTLANMPDWQRNALLTQALQTIQSYRSAIGVPGVNTAVGAPSLNTLPGLPQQPVLQAGANPSAAMLGAPTSTPMMRPEERIRSTLQAIPRAQ